VSNAKAKISSNHSAFEKGIKMSEKTSKEIKELPRFIEVSAEKGGLGKSLLANRTVDHLEAAGHEVILVRIDTKRVLSGPRPDNEIFIASEDIADAGQRVGGIVGVLDPLFKAIESKKHVVVDWGAGLVTHRLNAYAAVGMGSYLREMGYKPFAFIVATRDADVQKQAAANLKLTQATVPEFDVVVVLNERGGTFSFSDSSTPSAAMYGELMSATKGLRVLIIPVIQGEGWSAFANCGMTMPEVIQSENMTALAERIGRGRHIAAACRTYVCDWWLRTADLLYSVLPFRSAVE
jgi:hypothetical protein